MNLALTDEQEFLREAARGALSRVKTLEAAREALDRNAELPDLWPMAREAGWPGLLIDDANGGAGLDAFDAMLVLGECGRVLASIPLLGHLVATAILSDAPAGAPLLAELASGGRRAAYLAVKPPDDLSQEWTVDARVSSRREPAPSGGRGAPGEQVRVSGELAFVPDAPDADLLVGVALLDTPQGTGGEPTGIAVEVGSD